MPHPLLLACIAALALLGCAGTPPPPPTAPAAATPARPAKLALVLGGGAARGFAHVGVIKVLESQGIVPDIIVGSSAGAVVGALHAAGHNGFELQKLAHRLDESRISDWSLPARGVLKGEALQQFVNDAVGQRPLEALKRPFGAVATDLHSGESIVFRTGNTGMAVRASAAVPGVFQPVKVAGREYVDGGLSSLVPVRAARQMGADVVIAVDISARPAAQPVRSTFEILLQTFTIMGQSLARHELRDADVVIQPQVGNIGSTDFQARHDSILEGERAAQAALPKIREALRRPVRQ
ncbi:patatin-like phospholipase family protein [Accumulibacter sp.]|uniref:patatin-like phospholipase family protein n=1 Tax=Accumulibacter sp. TaxID=2053492 RepID=UPI0025FFFBF8|nr:patatin-like phospholipase family protein [Accumulibacter sp.]MCM8610849.1 patatin-like phospholipase family protein [Accumulibacter sp.]MCM8635246.1 patatin-like phospholipase family protein [Accumulibacter sp.]MCM8638617.1 patatin-like phospholipase family protein [Accumulibacter sp.]